MHTGVVRESDTRGRPSRSPLCTAWVESLQPLFPAVTVREVAREEAPRTRAD